MLTALRAAPTPLVLLLALPFLRFRLPRGASAWAYTAIGGLLMVGVFLSGFTEAVTRAGPGNAIVVASTSPFWVAIFSRLVHGERIRRRTAIGLLAGFAGVILIFSSQLGSQAGAGRTAVGLLFALAAALGWAAGVLIVKAQLTRQPDTDLLGVVAGQYLIGGAVLLAVAFATEGSGGAGWSSGQMWARGRLHLGGRLGDRDGHVLRGAAPDEPHARDRMVVPFAGRRDPHQHRPGRGAEGGGLRRHGDHDRRRLRREPAPAGASASRTPWASPPSSHDAPRRGDPARKLELVTRVARRVWS